jgi:hypothetical protein
VTPELRIRYSRICAGSIFAAPNSADLAPGAVCQALPYDGSCRGCKAGTGFEFRRRCEIRCLSPVCLSRSHGMLTYLILGMTFAFAAAVQPGPLQTYLISQTLSHGWRRTLPAAFSPLISDGPVILVTLLVLSRMPVWMAQSLRLAGGVFVLYLA